jgi:hypothetical protein
MSLEHTAPPPRKGGGSRKVLTHIHRRLQCINFHDAGRDVALIALRGTPEVRQVCPSDTSDLCSYRLSGTAR